MSCLSCWQPAPDDVHYHDRCLVRLLGRPRPPAIPFGLRHLPELGLRLVGRSSLAGVQQKLLVEVRDDRLDVDPAGRLILKPQSDDAGFVAVPENEGVTLALARLVEIRTVDSGLFRLADGTWALLVRRFDRGGDGQRLRFEDFCQLSRRPPKAKYDGSAERCAKIVLTWSAAPRLDLVVLFRRFLFAWWVGDDDLHLKNLGLLENAPYGRFSLAPAYDLVSSRVFPRLENGLAMPVGGKAKNLSVKNWRDFASYCQIPDRLTTKILAAFAAAEAPALDLISRSLLPAAFKEVYSDLIVARTDALTGRAARALRSHS